MFSENSSGSKKCLDDTSTVSTSEGSVAEGELRGKSNLTLQRERISGSIWAPGPAMLGPCGTDSPHFLKAQDCLWYSEEQHR